MLKKGVMALFIVVAMSAIIIGAFAITSNKNSSNNIASNQLKPLNNPLNNTSSANGNVVPANGNTSVPSVGDSVNNGKTSNSNGNMNLNGVASSNINPDNKNSSQSDSVGSISKHHTISHPYNVTVISPAEAQEIAAQYIEQAGATAGTPDLVSQYGKELYIVPVMLNNTNVGEIDIDANDGSNLGGAGGVET